MSIKSVNISDSVVRLLIHTHGVRPGWIMRADAKAQQKSEKTINLVFRHFTTKIQDLQNLVTQLIQKRHISNIHLPFSLYTIFFIYLDDLIQHCQNQSEQRDEEMDKLLRDIKHLFARNSAQLWGQTSEELSKFFEEIKNRLTLADMLPTQFNEIASLWSRIFKIQYAGELSLAALYTKGAKSTRISDELNLVPVMMSRWSVEKSFALLLPPGF
jgi:hypothetical protein